VAALPLIVFDVNETLLDLGTMEPTFEQIFGDKSAMRLWFANLILYSVALTVADSYVPFTDIGSAVMKMLADARRQNWGRGQERAQGQIFDDAPASGCAGRIIQTARCGLSAVHSYEQHY
jgi:hypothetical protein